MRDYKKLDVGYIDKAGFDGIMKRFDELDRKLWSYIKYLKMEKNE